MSRYTSVEKYVEVEVDLDDFEDNDIIEEMERRNLSMYDGDCVDELINKIFHLRRQGHPYDHLMDEFLYQKTGRAI